MKKLIGFYLSTAGAIARKIGGVPVCFWFFVGGVALVCIGAEQFHAGAGLLLSGLILVWDTTRDDNTGRRK